MTLVTSSNLDYLITPTRLYVGDITGSTFSDSLILTSLVSSVKYLQNRWSSKYLIYSSGMFVSGTTVQTPEGQCTLDTLPNENDVFRNCAVTFTSTAPPIIDQDDEFPIIAAASMFLRKSVIASSVTVFYNWSTPDLSFSNVQSSKTLLDLINADKESIDQFFKKRLGVPIKTTFPLAVSVDYLEISPIEVQPIIE